MLSEYLNQTALLCPALRNAQGAVVIDNYGAVQYAPAKEIACRRQPKARRLLNSEGEVITLSTEYYTTDIVATGDLLDGLLVRGVDQWIDLGGEVIGYKAVV